MSADGNRAAHILRARRRGHRGQTLVEFALVGTVAVFVLTGIIAGALLYFQNEAVGNGARSGSRYAAVESTLYSSSSGTVTCEGGSPDSIVDQVGKAMTTVPVNKAPLCAVSSTELQQTPVDPGKANIVVDALPSLAAPSCVTVTVTYRSQPIAVPMVGPITLEGFSSMPFLNTATSSSSTSSSASGCPAPHTPLPASSSSTSTATSSTTASTSTTSTATTSTATTSTSTSASTSTTTTTATTTTTTSSASTVSTTTSTFTWSGHTYFFCSTDGTHWQAC
ncbi:MAG TPA: TadE family protein [Candidatus Dormibacteraeota bacterium]|nr:TadE family protein [Candidatus Dormibacteraeota bacterium]